MESTAIDKQELIDWINELDDQAMLQNIKMLKESTGDKDWWNEISKVEKAGIKRGIEDVKAGRVTPHEDVRKTYKKWL